jgi:O-succinylbenzoate synthase
MRIDRIDIIHVKTPFANPFETSFTRFVERDALLVKLYSDGLVGYGECKAFHAPLYNPEDNATCRHVIQDLIAPVILHKKIESPAAFSRNVSFIRGNRLAIASVENALWELTSKRTGKSLKTLLGGTQSEIKVGVSLGIEMQVKDLLHKIENYLAEGYHRTKIKIKPGWDLDVLKEIRRHFPDITLTVDANSEYRLEDIKLFKAMDEFNLEYIEQPLAEDDIVDHAVLQKEINTAICLDESIISFDSARHAISLGSCRIINIKSSRCGGLGEALRIHDLCKENGIDAWVGGMCELGIGQAQNIAFASLPNFEKLAHDIPATKRFFTEDITKPSVEITARGTIVVPDETNKIQYQVDDDALERMMVGRVVMK